MNHPTPATADRDPAVIPPTSHLVLQSGSVVPDNWKAFLPDEASSTFPPDEPHWVVPLAYWMVHREMFVGRRHAVGICIDPADDPFKLLRPNETRIDPTGIALISVAFPNFNDGRGYSHAYALREHLGWTGELRAVGEVLIDTMFYLARCGFDSYSVKPGHDPYEALNALSTFKQRYQRGYREPGVKPPQAVGQ